MSKDKKAEIPYTQEPEFKYQITQQFMLDFVTYTQPPEVQLWYCDLVDRSKKTIDRGGKTFETLDIEAVRAEFIDKFFEGKFDKKKSGKPKYQDKVNDLRKKAEEALAKKKK